MPKKPKTRGARKGKDVPGGSDDNDSVINDNASVVSNASADSYMKDIEGTGGNVGGGEDDVTDDLTQDELFEEKLREAIDMATQKSANGRVEALNGLCRAFGKKFVPEFVDNRRLTIQDIIERSLKKGKSGEQAAAANLATSLCIQLRGEADDMYRDIKPILITIMTDKSSSASARISVANTLGNLCFLAAPAIVEVEAVMETFERIFSTHYSGGTDLLALCTAAVSSWTLLATVLPLSRAHELLIKHAELFGKLLDAPDVDLRIATGEAIAVLYEFLADGDDGGGSDGEDVGVEGSEDPAKEELERVISDLAPKLKQLSTDSQKFRSKKDRKEQKSSFRDILRTIEEGDSYYEKVAINKREKLEIESWAMKKQYEMVCKALTSGTNLHLTENELLRGVFEMGAPISSLSSTQSRPSKHERQFANQQAFKWRTQTRGKNRDKRSAVI